MVKRRVTRYRTARNVRASAVRGLRARLSPYAFGHAFGIVSVLALLFYTVMVWFSSYDGSIIIRQYPIAFSFYSWTLIIGLIETFVLSYIGGWIFVKVYNKTLREE